jgi:predicted ester cyclase
MRNILAILISFIYLTGFSQIQRDTKKNAGESYKKADKGLNDIYKTLLSECKSDTTFNLKISKETKNKKIAGRVFDEIFNQGKFEVANEIYSENFVNHGLHKNANLQEDQAAVHEEKKAFPNLKMSIDLMLAEDDLVTVIWTIRGTNTHSGYGIPFPTGVKIELRGITVWRIIDGKIIDEWTSFNQLKLYSQFIMQMKWQLIIFLFVIGLLFWLIYKLIYKSLHK